MADKLSGVQSSAASVLKRAVELDNDKRYSDALVCYQEGLDLLLQVMKIVNEEKKKQYYREKISNYMARAEKLKEMIFHTKANIDEVTHIYIKDDDTGFGYEKIFGKYLTMSVTEVIVEDPYIRNHHQILNFLRFCETIIKSEAKVKVIKLITSYDQNDSNIKEDQQKKLGLIKENLKKYSIELEISFSETLHDREITLNNGWKIKIGRGLNYFKKVGKFDIGTYDYDLRSCLETIIDIYKM
ncbi:DgyrCDS7988 [Dimorphilus gyrociliatus]|uniref:DgyrCDS7988 n=1 Tax=Dimorphilus gyrociliatus TaxID=2664684 RepID=A0A7I8VSY8_9ANNE|nr:DgyrCDS7988 [Dimorphilus gyrociliatus]